MLLRETLVNCAIGFNQFFRKGSPPLLPDLETPRFWAYKTFIIVISDKFGEQARDTSPLQRAFPQRLWQQLAGRPRSQVLKDVFVHCSVQLEKWVQTRERCRLIMINIEEE